MASKGISPQTSSVVVCVCVCEANSSFQTPHIGHFLFPKTKSPKCICLPPKNKTKTNNKGFYFYFAKVVAGLFVDDSNLCASFLGRIFLRFPGAQSYCFVKLTQLDAGGRTRGGEREDSRMGKRPEVSQASGSGSGSVPGAGDPQLSPTPPPVTQGARSAVAPGTGWSPPVAPPAPDTGGNAGRPSVPKLRVRPGPL